MEITYSGIHKWLCRNIPKLGECKFCKLETKTEWALKKGKKHAKDKKHYIELCRKCHFKYDWDEEKRKVQVQIAINMSKKTSVPIYCVETGKKYLSISEAVRETGITSIGHCLRKSKTGIAGGLHWNKLSTQHRGD